MPGPIGILYENNTGFRQIFAGGREHPRDQQPTWMGYSVGAWDRDTFVVESIGFDAAASIARRALSEMTPRPAILSWHARPRPASLPRDIR